MIDFDVNPNELNADEHFDGLLAIFTKKTLPLFLSILFVLEYAICVIFSNEKYALRKKIDDFIRATR